MPVIIKKKCLFIAGIVLLTLVSVGVYYLYCSYHPNIRISHGSGSHEGFYIEPVAISYFSRHDIPLAKSIEENLRELADANDIVVADLINNHIAPTDVRSSGEVKDGKTIIRYMGIVTTKDGETKDYEIEMVFNFVLDPDMKF